LAVLDFDNCPAVDIIIFLSAVKILFGLTKLSSGRVPEIKSALVMGIAKVSDLALLVFDRV
jgi:hypothetical protein